MTSITVDYPIEIHPVDISPYRQGNTGIDYAWTFDSGRPGPHVMVNSVIHGNELCGAIAVDFLLRREVRPKVGKLSLVFCNVAAYLSFDPTRPTVSRYVDEDMNRIWSPEVLGGARQSIELERARALRPLVDTVDQLLDIHSMQHATAPLSLAGLTTQGLALAKAIGVPAMVVCDEGHRAGRRLRDYGDFGIEGHRRAAALVECGQHWEKASADVAMAATLRFLRLFDIVDEAFFHEHQGPDTAPPQQIVRVTEAVTIETDHFSFAEPYIGLEVIEKAGTRIGTDGDRPVVTPYDRCILIMPSRRLTKGNTAVRLGRFVG
ncbi:MAG: succinylglutamate desuccinylase/aspartoacylase family protein [Alphaproteobacteria bacterium]|nr:succinylglutamate desuccinylase/aspartoacylase family protein [Alphaproteobacteria bacterium]